MTSQVCHIRRAHWSIDFKFVRFLFENNVLWLKRIHCESLVVYQCQNKVAVGQITTSSPSLVNRMSLYLMIRKAFSKRVKLNAFVHCMVICFFSSIISFFVLFLFLTSSKSHYFCLILFFTIKVHLWLR